MTASNLVAKYKYIVGDFIANPDVDTHGRDILYDTVANFEV